MRIYESNVRKGQARGRDGTIPEALAPELPELCGSMSARLRSGEYRFTQYREYLVIKGAGKAPRVLSVPTARDRIALRALAEFLVEIFPQARGELPQVRIEQVKAQLARSSFDSYVRLDVRDFYPSISHSAVEEALKRRIRKLEIRQLILRAIQTPTVPDRGRRRPAERSGVPQGLAISNILAEIVTSPVDLIFGEDQRCAYFRFVDDVLLLCNSCDARALAGEAVEYFRKEGLEVHPLSSAGSKSCIGRLSSGFDFLGYVFLPEKVTVRAASIYKLESALARPFTRYRRASHSSAVQAAALGRCLWYLNLVITGCVHKGVARGWVSYFRQMNDLILLKRLDATVARFCRRFDMPASFTPKTFMQTYWAVQYPMGRHRGYVPNFDAYNVDQMRHELIFILGAFEASHLSDREIIRRFQAEIDRAVSDLEKDIGSLS